MNVTSGPIRLAIFCDESTGKGEYFSNFYGGALVDEKELDAVNKIIEARKQELNLHQEVKFTKITENYADKYIDLMKTFFELIVAGKVKIRIMFTQNDRTATLTREQHRNSYFLLYYQFVKHGFGLRHMPGQTPVCIRMLFDLIPGEDSQKVNFKTYINGIQNQPEFLARKIEFAPNAISEIDSKKHVVLQCLDIILGAMQFRLNNHQLRKPEGKRKRAKKTVAKERVYKAIYKEVDALFPNYHFNIGVTTSANPSWEFRWKDPYRHWLFKPTNSQLNTKYVPKNK